MTLGQRIQAHRVRLGLSQEGLGDKLGVSRQAVSKWEADGAVPDTNKLIALSKLFGISLNELLQVDGPPPAGERPPVHRPKAKAVLAVALVLALLALAGTSLSLAARVTALEEQVAALQSGAQELDPAELVAGWDFGVINDNEAGRAVEFQVTVARYDPEEELEVFFLLSGLGVGAERAQADRISSAQDAGVYTATINLEQRLSNDPFTLSVGFVKDGVEYLQPLADFSFLDKTSSIYEPLWP